MRMTEGHIYRCQNLHCGSEIKVVKKSIEANANPRCCCGSQMKKLYAKPMLRTLISNFESLTVSGLDDNDR
jgi:predicted nucleic acid-binding Zn ribbon protein